MKDLTVILPLHKYDETVSGLLKNATESFKKADYMHDTKLIVIAPKEVLNSLEKEEGFTYVESSDKKTTEFQSLVNQAVQSVTTKYFSILEYDDQFYETWFRNVEKYINSGLEESVVLPLTEVYDYENPAAGPLGYINEAVWASSFSEKIGYFDSDCLQDYLLFNATGGIFNKEDFVSLGGLKESIKLSFWYEYFLRLLHFDKNIYVIPKVGYFHIVNRKGSLIDSYSQQMEQKEIDWWTDLAKKECLYKKDREIKYE